MPLPPVTPAGIGTATLYARQTSAGTGFPNNKPGPTNAPLIYEPGPELSDNKYVVWMVATGGGPDFGGCQVHVSIEPGGTGGYEQVGQIQVGEVQGFLAADFASGSDPDTANTLSIDLTESRATINSATATDADAFLTLCLVDDELIAYSAATLTSTYHYDLDTRIRRGLYGTTIAAHPTGSPFARISAATFRQRYQANLVGSTIWVKLPAFNLLGTQAEDLASVLAYSYVLTGAGVDTNCNTPVNNALAAGVTLIDWGTLDSDCTSATADWGLVTDKLCLCIDMGTLGTDLETAKLWAPSVSLAGPADGGRLPNNGEEMFVIEPTVAVRLPLGLVGSEGACAVAPTADAVFTLKHNGVTIGTATFAAGTLTPVFSFAASVDFAPTDRFSLIAPSPQDATLADFWFTFKGSR